MASIFGLNLFVSPKLYKDMTAYQQILLKLVTDHPTSQNRMDCLTHVWSGPMGGHVTKGSHPSKNTGIYEILS